MPNPILRAGPFASSTDSFLAEPGTASDFVVPVNCAKAWTFAQWPWRYLEVIMESRSASNSTVTERSYPTSGSSSVVVSAVGQIIEIETSPGEFVSDVLAIAIIRFRYQASKSFTFSSGSKLEIEWSAGGDAEWAYNIFVGGTLVAGDSDIAGGVGGSETFDLSGITMPAAIKPIEVRILASTVSAGSTSISAESKITLIL